MADVRSLPTNGKLIYELTSASALKDTDLLPISSDNLTRKVSLTQLKSSINNDFYNKDDMNTILDELKLEIKNLHDKLFADEGNITEFRNEFNNILNVYRDEFNKELNDIRSEFNTTLTQFEGEFNTKIEDVRTDLTTQLNDFKDEYNQYKTTVEDHFTSIETEMQYNYDELNAKIESTESSLIAKITNVEATINEKIDSLITYGTGIPTTLETGKVYLQYF